MLVHQKTEGSKKSRPQRFEVLRQLTFSLNKPPFKSDSPVIGVSHREGNFNLAVIQNIWPDFNIDFTISPTNVHKKSHPGHSVVREPLVRIPSSKYINASHIANDKGSQYFISRTFSPKNMLSGILPRETLVKKSANFSLSTTKTELQCVTAEPKGINSNYIEQKQLTVTTSSGESLIYSLAPICDEDDHKPTKLIPNKKGQSLIGDFGIKEQDPSFSFETGNQSIIAGDTPVLYLHLNKVRPRHCQPGNNDPGIRFNEPSGTKKPLGHQNFRKSSIEKPKT
jgi:hypothetical protein